MSSDPIGIDGGSNTFSYVDGAPLRKWDPMGLVEYPDSYVGPLPPNGYRTSEMTVTACGRVPPAPPNVSIDSNLKTADQKDSIIWFYRQVRNGAPWDYKQIDSKYEDYGNYNYGATGSAMEIPEWLIQRAAGYASQKSDPSNRKSWGSPWGSYPYGDDPADQEQIEKGIKYCQCRGY